MVPMPSLITKHCTCSIPAFFTTAVVSFLLIYFAMSHSGIPFSLDQDISKSLRNRELVMLKRKQHFQHMCEKYSDMTKLYRPRQNTIPTIYMKEFDASFCALSKTGSTTLALQLHLAVTDPNNRKRKKDIQVFMRRKYPQPKKISTLERVTNFIFVRHPFTRLVSSYKARIRFHAAEVRFYHKLHAGGLDVNGNDNVTFSQFVDYLLAGRQSPGGPGSGPFLGPGPGLRDMHFKPYWRRCDLCYRPLDWIGQTETSAEDKEFIFRRLGLPLQLLDMRRNKHGHQGQSEEYFSTLTRRQIEGLYEMYKIDFELFGYDHLPWVELAKEDFSVDLREETHTRT